VIKPHWLIRPTTDLYNLSRLISAIKKCGSTYEFEDDDCVTADVSANFPVIVHGSIEFVRDVPRSLFPGGHWLELPLLKCSSYYTRLTQYLLNAECGFYPFGMLPTIKEWLYTVYSEPGDTPTLGRLLFIRPDDNEKSFTGLCVAERMFDPWYRELIHSLHPETLVVVSRFKQIRREWRLIMVDGSPVTGSLYRHENQYIYTEGFPAKVGEYAHHVGRVWSPAPAWVLDIAELMDGALKVCEVGGVNCAGWYAADYSKAVAAINTAAVREWCKR
jgi:hypothetical protein